MITSTAEHLDNVRAELKRRRITYARIAQWSGNHPSTIGTMLRGNFPHDGACAVSSKVAKVLRYYYDIEVEVMAHMVYIVTAAAGDYDDYRTWIVAVHADPITAETHRRKAQRRAARLRQITRHLIQMAEKPGAYPKRFWGDVLSNFDGSRYVDEFFRTKQGSNPYDPNADICGHGHDAHYSVEAFEVQP